MTRFVDAVVLIVLVVLWLPVAAAIFVLALILFLVSLAVNVVPARLGDRPR